MDLYGSGASIAQANAQTEAARQINEATRDFNNTLAEQLDESNLAQDEDRSSKLQKNILSGVTSGGKLVAKRAAIKQGAKLGFKEVSTSLAERMGKEVGQERAGISTAEELRAAAGRLTGTADEVRAEQFARGADIEALTAETGPLRTRTGLTVGVPTQEGLREAEAAAPTELYSAEQQGLENVAGDVEGSAAARTALKEGAEDVSKFLSRAKTFGKLGVAGLGGGIDAFQDVGRYLSGEKGMDAFGSNNAARYGNIGNIVGSALEVAGVATGGVTPIALALETTGAGISLVSSLVEGAGELESAEKSKETAAADITSQKRGEVSAEGVEQAVGRTQ
tara:strand:- start:8817 stop:9827 length:1011 start_codon:yes stop_codon:yes gene_type:complete